MREWLDLHIGTYWYRLVQIGTDWYRLVQIGQPIRDGFSESRV